MVGIVRCLVVAVLLFSAKAQAGSLAGTYVGTGPDRVGMLQLIETETGKFVGHYEEIGLVAGQKLESINAIVTGNSDGSTIILAMARAGELEKQFLFSGSLSGGVLTLTGGSGNQSATLKLTASSVDVFNVDAAELSKRANLMQAAQEIETAKPQLEDLVHRMASFNQAADQELQKIPAAEERLRQLTHRMISALQRQQSIPPIASTLVVRTQIGVAINQGGVESSQFHIQLQSKQAEFKKNSDSALAEVKALLSKCGKSIAGIDGFTNSLTPWRQLCSQAPGVVAEFQSNADRMLAAYEHAESVWQTENRAQQSIIRTSAGVNP